MAKRWLDLDKNYVEWRSIAVLDKRGEGEGDSDSEEDSEDEDEDDDVSEDGMGEIGDASDYESDEEAGVHMGGEGEGHGEESTDAEEEGGGVYGSFRRT